MSNNLVSATNYSADIFSAINDLDIESRDSLDPSIDYQSLDSDFNSIDSKRNTMHRNLSQDSSHFSDTKQETCDSGQHSHHSELELAHSEDFYGASQSIQLDQSIAGQSEHRSDKLLSFLLIDQDELLQVGL